MNIPLNNNLLIVKNEKKEIQMKIKDFIHSADKKFRLMKAK